MDNPQNDKLIKYTIEALIDIISRRTSKDTGYKTLKNVTDKLRIKYNFLDNVTINYSRFSETLNQVSINPNINTIDSENIVNSIIEIVDLSTKAIGEKADYFFIREIRDALPLKNDPKIYDFLMGLNYKQTEYIVERKEEKDFYIISIRNIDIIEPFINSLISILSKKELEVKPIQLINKLFLDLQEKYDFLSYVNFSNEQNEKKYVSFSINPEIDEISQDEIAKALTAIINNIINSINWNQEKSFLSTLKEKLGEERINHLIRIGVDLNKIENNIKRQELNLTQKIFEALIGALKMRMHVEKATEKVTTVVSNLSKKHDVLKFISVNSSMHNKGVNAFEIDSDIDDFDAYKLGKAYRDIIKTIQNDLKDKMFIEDFKKILGDEYLEEIEKMGVNLFFLSLKFG